MYRLLSFVVLAFFFAVPGALAQTPTPEVFGPLAQVPENYPIRAITIEGVEEESIRNFVLQTSGLQIGQNVMVPGDPGFSEAIRAIYTRLGMFSDVKILTEETTDGGVNVTIQVREEPELDDLNFTGVSSGQSDDLDDVMGLLPGRPVRPNDIEYARQAIRDYFAEDGYLLAEVTINRTVDPVTNTVDLDINVDQGPLVEISDIVIEGNAQVSERSIRRRLDETREDRWWRFWSKSRFNEQGFQEDLQRVIDYYNERGYYDARIVQDSAYVVTEDGEPEMVVEILVHEGPQYRVRNVEWEGNTVLPDEVLSRSLGLERGEVFNRTQLEENLFGNAGSSDVRGLYMNQGYMLANVVPVIQVVEGDSVDIHVDISEGDIYTFGNIVIEGNTKTKEHVVRRELYTIPGQTFSRDAIQESIRRLSQLSYFTPESLSAGPSIQIDEANKEVDLVYSVEEASSDQLELSGTWGQFGIVLQLRFTFNNFSAQNLLNRDAWRPLPSGDGQQLSLGVQTNGRYYQSYSMSFTEPWFRGRPTPVGFSLSHSRLSNPDATLADPEKIITSSLRGFYNQRLRWPDDFFNTSTSVGYQYYFNEGRVSSIPQGISQEVSLEQGIERNSLDNPMFPMSGSNVRFSVRVAPPIPGFIQYHKWRFTSSWNVPLSRSFSIGAGADYGYVGSFTNDPVNFERFDVGGSPFDTQGSLYRFGTDIVYMRGYPASAISPRRNGDVVGGTILNKYTSELRWRAVQTAQLQAMPYLFFDAANTWSGFSNYNPAALYRSAGFGIRLVLPIVGLFELTYGYNFDEFINPDSDNLSLEPRGWRFQFSMGQGFN
jgi:outer membrane protein insertion porin family